ncbi:MAG TPA: hypothetical protein VGJ66_07310 [Pyrinomonadaceae bacterium]|jgi:hypothetical protein
MTHPLPEFGTDKTDDKFQEALIKWKRQLLGVRRPGAALVGRDLSRLSLNCVILKNAASSLSDQSGARPPHSKELST